jgi:hypothetical protein
MAFVIDKEARSDVGDLFIHIVYDYGYNGRPDFFYQPGQFRVR